MIKKYLLLAFILTSFVSQAQWQISWQDFMNYSLGPVHQGRWTSYSGNAGPQDMEIINNGPAQFDGNHGYIGNSGQDAVLQLGNKTSGRYSPKWLMWIPSGKSAYYGILTDENPSGNGDYAIHVYFNRTGSTPGAGEIFNRNNTLLATFNYPENALLYYGFIVNLNDDTILFEWNSNVIYDGPFYSNGGNLGAINFWRYDANTEFYVDNFQLWENLLSTNDFSEDVFKVYPNPVQDVLNIETQSVVDSVIIYDMLGKEILSEQPSIISPSIDMSELASGIYSVKVTIGDASKTIKIIK